MKCQAPKWFTCFLSFLLDKGNNYVPVDPDCHKDGVVCHFYKAWGCAGCSDPENRVKSRPVFDDVCGVAWASASCISVRRSRFWMVLVVYGSVWFKGPKTLLSHHMFVAINKLPCGYILHFRQTYIQVEKQYGFSGGSKPRPTLFSVVAFSAWD